MAIFNTEEKDREGTFPILITRSVRKAIRIAKSLEIITIPTPEKNDNGSAVFEILPEKIMSERLIFWSVICDGIWHEEWYDDGLKQVCASVGFRNKTKQKPAKFRAAK